MNVMSRKTLPALLTGNTVVFKPATFTPWSGIFMAQLFERAGLPAGVFNCVTGLGSAIGNVIVEDPRVRAITFTGSTEVGKKIQVKGSVNLTRMQLELGGKNALIVMDDADIDEAVGADDHRRFFQWRSVVHVHQPGPAASRHRQTVPGNADGALRKDDRRRWNARKRSTWGRLPGRSNSKTSRRRSVRRKRTARR